MLSKINSQYSIGIIGLGYVGLPLAIEFGKKYKVFAYDTNIKRIKELKNKIDINKEIGLKKFNQSKKLFFTNKINELSKCNIYIVSVPTPINKKNQPNLKLLFSACQKISTILKKKDIVIFESTVYPGLTEEFCVPILEKKSDLIYNKDFFCGYSPERINPGDKLHTLDKVIKITSGSNLKTSLIVDKLYKSIIKSGTFMVSSIKIAEAAKVIENTQRDLNIAFINELAVIFDKMNINTYEVLSAASTKWNFLNFSPGLVGGHCIGVDPYYLTYKSQKLKYNPKLILAGRKINENFANFLISKLFKQMKLKNIKLNKSKFLIMGLTFKENCNDIRNSKVLDITDKLIAKKISFDIYDPLLSKKLVPKKLSNKLITIPKKNYYDVILITVAHQYFIDLGIDKIINFTKEKNIIFDIKNIFNNKHLLKL